MSTLALAPTLLDQVGGEPTLDELLVGVWEGLAARQVVECPACQGEMEPRLAADGQASGGRCGACGAALS